MGSSSGERCRAVLRNHLVQVQLLQVVPGEGEWPEPPAGAGPGTNPLPAQGQVATLSPPRASGTAQGETQAQEGT